MLKKLLNFCSARYTVQRDRCRGHWSSTVTVNSGSSNLKFGLPFGGACRTVPLLAILLCTAGCSSESSPEAPQAVLSPTQVVENYFALMQEGQVAEAIAQHWNTKAAVQRMFPEDYPTLSAEDQEKLAAEYRKVLVLSNAMPAAVESMARMQISQPQETHEGDLCTVQLEASRGDGTPARTLQALLAKDGTQWKLIDIAAPDGSGYFGTKFNAMYITSGTTPLSFLKRITASIPSSGE